MPLQGSIIRKGKRNTLYDLRQNHPRRGTVWLGAAGQRVLVLERDPAPFMRATYINQARVHMGYHYPRSYSTAIKSAHYFERFCRDYGFCLHTEFDQVYATSAHFSTFLYPFFMDERGGVPPVLRSG